MKTVIAVVLIAAFAAAAQRHRELIHTVQPAGNFHDSLFFVQSSIFAMARTIMHTAAIAHVHCSAK